MLKDPVRRVIHPENVGSQFLSLLQSGSLQTFSAAILAVKKASFRAVLRAMLGVLTPERYGNSLRSAFSLRSLGVDGFTLQAFSAYRSRPSRFTGL
jgi:hypothetical protein